MYREKHFPALQQQRVQLCRDKKHLHVLHKQGAHVRTERSIFLFPTSRESSYVLREAFPCPPPAESPGCTEGSCSLSFTSNESRYLQRSNFVPSASRESRYVQREAIPCPPPAESTGTYKENHLHVLHQQRV